MFSCTHFLVLLSFRPVFASGPCRGIGTPLCQGCASPRSFWRGVTRRTSASSSTSSSVCLAGPCFLRVVERTFPRRGHRHRQNFFQPQITSETKDIFKKQITSESIRPEPCCSARTSLCALIWSKCSEFLLECPGLCRRVPSFYRNVPACARLSYDFALMFQVFHGIIWMFSCLPIFFRVFFMFSSCFFRVRFPAGGATRKNTRETRRKHEENMKKTRKKMGKHENIQIKPWKTWNITAKS